MGEQEEAVDKEDEIEAEGMNQLVEFLPSIPESPRFETKHKIEFYLLIHARNLNSCEVKSGISRIQGTLQLHNMFEAFLGT